MTTAPLSISDIQQVSVKSSSRNHSRNYVRVAVGVPLRKGFDFAWSDALGVAIVGLRVRVPFGRRTMIGIVTEVDIDTVVPENKIKGVIAALDAQSIFSPALWRSLQWASSYYQAPMGEMLLAALPKLLRDGESSEPCGEIWYIANATGEAVLNRAPKQLLVYQFLLAQESTGASTTILDANLPGWRAAMRQLKDKQLITCQQREITLTVNQKPASPIRLNNSQRAAAQAINDAKQSFCPLLLHGTTGSGKTEVYFEAMDHVLARGEQVMLLVPEIGLTPQLMERVSSRFSYPVVILHSGLGDRARHSAWSHINRNSARIVVGTRSAVFAPFKSLGLIVVDEEHDASFKQQDGVRYNARDFATYLARQWNVPIVFGSATPSFESLSNAQRSRYQYLTLKSRAGGSSLPSVEIIDMQKAPIESGLSLQLTDAIKARIARGEQSLLFLNRRGFAPVLYCNSCNEGAKCHRCDAYLTFHKARKQLRCHHCGYQGVFKSVCTTCGEDGLSPVGEGTQQLEQVLKEKFPEASIIRVDRDSAHTESRLVEMLDAIQSGAVDIVLGTQLLSKGHDFPNVTLVGIINADQGLFSTDFRGAERSFQQLIQVAGRAGRRKVLGQVLIQTWVPGNPFFKFVCEHDFENFSKLQLSERKMLRYPPFEQAILFRAESNYQGDGLNFLQKVRNWLHQRVAGSSIRVYDPVPSPMERRAGRYRAQLMLLGADRKLISRLINDCCVMLEADRSSRKVRWSVDVDPIDTY
ncbi:MAG: primosomal protein N' [Proteobacteria bacterium]|jgi:primosomal protein N' (replication factor Y) (superfamily II helicase)|nr:primosomal protein N' [Pseudomonadota bacterium]